MKLTIDRTRWLRGEGAGSSSLLRSSDGKMCCLGFLALACGLEADQIRDVPAPSTLTGTDAWPTGTFVRNIDRNLDRSYQIKAAMHINDELGIDPAVREHRLAEHLAKLGVDVEFVG